MSAGAGASALQDFLSSGAVCGPLHSPFFVDNAAQGPVGRQSIDPSASITHSAQRADIDETLEPGEYAEEEEGEMMPVPATIVMSKLSLKNWHLLQVSQIYQ